MTKRARSAGLALLLALLACRPAPGGVILNTLQSSGSDQPGWSGSLDAVFSGSGGNTEKIVLEVGGQTQWQNEADRLRLHVSGGYEESSGVETARNVAAHLRHNRRLGRNWSSVGFAQIQHNPFQRLESRWLLGAGLRRDFRDPAAGIVALGATPMLEIERIEDQAGHLARGRLSVFLHVGQQLSPTVRLDVTGFWQPLLGDVGAMRAIGNLALTVAMTRRVELKLGAAVEDNSRPPAGVERTDWSSYMGLGTKF